MFPPPEPVPAARRQDRVPVRDYLMKQGRFAHLIDEDINHIQAMVDSMWNEWELPGIAPVRGDLALAKN